MPTIDLSIAIKASPQRCFDLSRDIDVHVRSMRGTDERAVAGVTHGLIGEGGEVTWEARHFLIRWRHTARITAFHPPEHFQDTMIAGAFASFVHDHYFTTAESGETMMRDVVRFRSPLGPLGWVVDRAVMGRYMTNLIRGRQVVIRDVAEQGET